LQLIEQLAFSKIYKNTHIMKKRSKQAIDVNNTADVSVTAATIISTMPKLSFTKLSKYPFTKSP